MRRSGQALWIWLLLTVRDCDTAAWYTASTIDRPYEDTNGGDEALGRITGRKFVVCRL